jgi:hypothetical protein
MGLLDSLLKRGTDALAGKAAEVLENATGLDLDGDGNARRGQAGYDSQYPAQAVGVAPAAAGAGQAEPLKDRAFFANILAQEFPEYTVHEFVSPATLGGSGRDCDFGLYRGGHTAGMVMLVEHNRDNNAAYRNARSTAQRAGVPFINFYLHMPNERNFVIGRIRRLAD